MTTGFDYSIHRDIIKSAHRLLPTKPDTTSFFAPTFSRYNFSITDVFDAATAESARDIGFFGRVQILHICKARDR